jgi:F0F1-type ATP synthase assembly protein I
MLHDCLSRLYLKTILVQAAVGLPMALIGFVWGGEGAGWSALVGAAVVVIGTVTYAILARHSKVSAVAGATVFRRHLVAEGAKIFVVVALMFGALASGWFAAGWLVAAMVVALLGHGLLVFLIR